jgi:hypothetical protein
MVLPPALRTALWAAVSIPLAIPLITVNPLWTNPQAIFSAMETP